ncbi:MAG: histidinol dehydrogenase [Bacteroidales bacterium]|nr:histidinol dehydrogenase [Bacteroidales bacterium]
MIKQIINPPRKSWRNITRRVNTDDGEITSCVKDILSRVKLDGDKALRALAKEIDKVELESLIVPEAVICQCEKYISPELKEAVRIVGANIEKFHKAQITQEIDILTSPGVRCVRRSIPIQRIGLYIPGGSAPLFSTILMLAIPARIAGCKEVIICTPPGKEGRIAPEILYAAHFCGVNRIFRVGGAQAIAAMAYGTDSIPKVDKIFGPGNRYVTKAKQLVSLSDVAIDMPAGPSEVMVMADESARSEFIAADMLSQAEHGADSQCVLVCKSVEIAKKVNSELEKQSVSLTREKIVLKALENSMTVIFDNENDMIDFVNYYAPEHLIISTKNPWLVAERIVAAGSIFIGNYSPESAGDYASGTNHTLPTSGWAKSYSGIGTDSFMRRMTYQELSHEGLRNLGDTIVEMAIAEGLDAHANAVKIRLKI